MLALPISNMSSAPTCSSGSDPAKNPASACYGGGGGSATASSSCEGEKVFQMQMELTSLRQRLKTLESCSTESRSELLDLLAERDSELQTKNEQLAHFNDKFHKITAGLAQIEAERSQHRKAATQLEADKKKTQRHLDIREKEVNTLVQRCAAQEDRIQADKDLRTANGALQKEATALKRQLAEQQTRLLLLPDLQEKLQNTDLERQDAISKYKALKVKNTECSDGLLAIIAGLEKSEGRSEAKIEELERSLTRFRIEKDDAKKDHAKIVSAFREDVKKGEEKIKSLQDNLIGYGATISALRSERAEMKKKHEFEVSDLNTLLVKQKYDLEHLMTTAIGKLENEKDKEIQVLQKELEEKVFAVDQLQKDKELQQAQSLQLSGAFDKACHEKEAASLRSRTEIDRLVEEKSSLSVQLTEQREEVGRLRSSLSTTNEENSALYQEITQLHGQIVVLQNETAGMKDLDRRLQAADLAIAQLEDRNKVLTQESNGKIESLRLDLEGTVTAKNALERDLLGKLSAVQVETAHLKKDLEVKLAQSQDLTTSLETEIATLKHTEKTLVERLDHSRFTAEQKESSHQTEINKLTEGLQTARLQMTDMEKELHLLKEVSLKESQASVATLNEEVVALKQKIETTEMEAAEIVADLESQIERFTAKYVSLQKQHDDRTVAHEQTVLNFEKQLLEIATAKSKIEIEMKIKDKNLEERHANITSLVQKRTAQEEKIKSLRAELDLLIVSYEKAKSNHQRTVVSLELDMDQLRTCAEEDAFAFQEDMDRMQDAMVEIEKQLEEKDDVLVKAQTSLNDRTKLLGDMVSQNKDLEIDLQEARALVSELQEESNAYLRKNEAIEHAVARLKMQLELVENAHVLALNEEKQSREAVEYELETARAALDRARVDCKDTAELEKENAVLRDKVKRQEAYLKRKLQKEKVLKERINGQHPLKVETGPQSPKRKGSMQNITANYGAAVNPARSGSVPRSRPLVPDGPYMSTKVTCDSPTHQDELEDLLGEV